MLRGDKRSRVIGFFVLLVFVMVYSFSSVEILISDIVEIVESARLEAITSGYSTEDTEHFRIKYTTQDANVLDRVVQEAEEQYSTITGYFRFYPDDKITLIIYPSKEELEKGLRLPSEDATLGAFYSGTISILSPNEWGKAGDQAEKGLYIHELTHLIMDEMAAGNYPIWFTEGMALYQEYKNTGFEWGENYLFNNKPYSLEELTHHFNELEQMLAYRQSFLLVKAVMEKNDTGRLLELFGMLKKGVPFDRAFEAVTGYSPEDLEKSI